MNQLQLAFLIILLPLLASSDPTPKERIVWTYWSGDLNSAPLFPTFCINNLIHYTTASGWEFRLVTPSNLTDFLSPESIGYLGRIKEARYKVALQSWVDIYRMLLLYDNGGMWVDATLAFTRDLKWIEEIDSQSLVYNKVAPLPEMIVFTSNSFYGGNKTSIFDEELQADVVLYPGMEIWSLISIPKSIFIKEYLEATLYVASKKSIKEYFDQNEKQGYKYTGELSEYFIYSNYQFQTLFQRKQRQIDSYPEQFREKYAVEYYRQWSIDSFQTAFFLFENNRWTIGNILPAIFYSQEDLQVHRDRYLIKFTGGYYPALTSFLYGAEPLMCLEAIGPVPTDSIASKFLFEFSPTIEVVQTMREIERRISNKQEMSCSLLPRELYNSIFYSGLAALILLLGGNVCIFYLMMRCSQEKKEVLEELENEDNDLN